MTTRTDTTTAGELEAIRRTFRIINRCVWSVAAGVMVYGVPIAYQLLVAHDVPPGIAWMLSLLVDAALVVGLVATPILARYGIRAGWVGMLRWVSGLFTWALQTTGSWIKQDWIGVLLHSLGPVILFVVVEAAAYFQRKMSAKISELEAATRKATDDRAADKAEIAALRQKLAALTAEHTAVDTVRLTVEEQAATITALKADLNAAEQRRTEDLNALTERLTADHNETVRALKEKHTAALARARAETSTVNLNDYRRTHTGKGSPVGSPKTAGRPAMSDEEAVQAMLAVTRDPGHDWSQNAVRTLTGAGFSRAQKLIAAWREAATVTRTGKPDEATG